MPSKEDLNLLNKTVDFFQLYHDAFYKKDLNLAYKIQTEKIKIFNDKIYPALTKKDNTITYHAAEIIRLIQVASTVVFGMHFNPE